MQAFPKAEGVLNAPEGLEGGEACESALPPPLPPLPPPQVIPEKSPDGG